MRGHNACFRLEIRKNYFLIILNTHFYQELWINIQDYSTNLFSHKLKYIYIFILLSQVSFGQT